MNVFEKTPSAAWEAMLRPLLDYLARAERRADGRWGIWRIANIDGGRNNRLYRASCALGDLVVKFTIRDERDRAGREFGALTALRQAGLELAPIPLLLDRDRYALPVVVQTWLTGDVSDAVPASDDDWEKIVRHLVAVHSVTPDTVDVELRTALPEATGSKGHREGGLTTRGHRGGRAGGHGKISVTLRGYCIQKSA